MSVRFALWSFLSGTAGILAIHGITELVGHPLLIGSFGASAVLLFGATDSPLAQPCNLVGVQGAAGPEYILVPVLAGALILLETALFTNNLVYHRRYPRHWL